MDSRLSNETLAAFVDGELPPEEMRRVAALVATHPEMERYVRQQERLRLQLRDSFAEIDARSLPQRLLQTAGGSPVSRRWRLRQFLHREQLTRTLVPLGATLLIGAALGWAIRPRADFRTDATGQLVAQGPLGRALDRQLASADRPGSGPFIGISFRDKTGKDCRTFVDKRTSGLACHRNGTWVVGTLVNQTPDARNYVYRMAGSELPDAVRRAVTASIVGTPFDAQTERSARDGGWK
jgi:hypothetical protein